MLKKLLFTVCCFSIGFLSENFLFSSENIINKTEIKALGQYQIHGDAERLFLLDTASGHVWERNEGENNWQFQFTSPLENTNEQIGSFQLASNKYEDFLFLLDTASGCVWQISTFMGVKDESWKIILNPIDNNDTQIGMYQLTANDTNLFLLNKITGELWESKLEGWFFNQKYSPWKGPIVLMIDYDASTRLN